MNYCIPDNKIDISADAPFYKLMVNNGKTKLHNFKSVKAILEEAYPDILSIDANKDLNEAFEALNSIIPQLKNDQDYYKYRDCISGYYNVFEINPPVDENGDKLWQHSFEMKGWIDNKINEEHRGEEEKQGGKRKAKSKKNNVSKKPAVSQKKQSEYKEILGKKMKIYKKPDSRKQYVRYKGELHSISDYKNLMKQKATAKPAAKAAAKSKK